MDDELSSVLGKLNERLEALEQKQAPPEEVVEKHDTTSGAMMGQRLHGIGGLWSGPGLDQVVISTYVQPMSVRTILPNYPTVFEDPRFAALTGFTAPDGSQPTNACDDAPSGFTKSCQLTALFGLKRFDTQELEMDRIISRVNRGDFGDLRLMGDVLPKIFGNMLGGVGGAASTADDALNVATAAEMLRAANYMEMALHIDTWQGNALTGTFPGLDSQIATGQVDAATNTACPSLDSDVKGFAWNDVCGTTLDIVEYLSAMEFYIKSLAQSTGMMPVKWVWVMRPELWHELSACWPCKYNTNRCTSGYITSGDQVVSLMGNEMITERDAMRRGLTLDVNGTTYPVILDSGIFEFTEATGLGNLKSGEFASSIYFLPLTIQGAFPVTYFEYLDYRQAARDEAYLGGKQVWTITDAGAYSWAWSFTKWCFKGHLKTEQRVVLRTPQLAGKLQYVKYSPLQHLREPDFSSPYHVDGGVSLPSTGTRYAVWNSGGIQR
jgi:hypothetical protein